MDCQRVDLIDYAFGTGDADRREVEAHVLGCTACLEAYLAWRRAEEAQEAPDRPSPEARLRLRRDVARAFPRRGSPVAWLRRPVPVYQGLAVVGLAILAAAVVPALLHRAAPLPEGARVDTSRSSAASLGIY